MLETIRTTRGVLADPPPQVRTLSYDDSSISYQVRFAINDFSILPGLKDEFATRIWYAAKRNGLNIPFPIRTLYHYDGEAVDAAADESAVTNSLSQLATLTTAPQEDALSEGMIMKHFAAGETVLKAGEKSNLIYTVLSGQVSLRLDTDNGSEALLTLAQGDIFGVESLLRGEGSSVNIIALHDLELVGLTKEAVMKMVRRKPSFARELEEIIEARAARISQARESIKTA